MPETSKVEVKSISVEEYAKLSQPKTVDVRGPGEYNSAHLKDA